MANRAIGRLARVPAIALVAVVWPPLLAANAEPARGSLAAPPAVGWVCNAYGYKRRWITVSGVRKRTKNDAEKQVLRECSGTLFACQLSGCWHQ
jgi:hypothetical protein